MTEKKGHFDKGVWVDEPVAPAPKPADKQIEERLTTATKNVISAVDELAKATHDLLATEEGKKHIEKTVKETTDQVQKSFDDILSRAKAEMDKAKAEVEKKAKQKK
jgi:cell division protein ZapA (FtsZ GTPase activity inhibitor)